jgi:hypothetical protein
MSSLSKDEIMEKLTFFGYKLVAINNDKNIPESEIDSKLDEIIAELNRELSLYRIDIHDIEVLDDAIIYTFHLESTVKDEPNYYVWMKIYRYYDGYRYGIAIAMKEFYQTAFPFAFRFAKNFIKKVKVGEFTNWKSLEFVNQIIFRLFLDGQALKTEVGKIISELDDKGSFRGRLKLDRQVLLHILKETAKEFDLF